METPCTPTVFWQVVFTMAHILIIDVLHEWAGASEEDGKRTHLLWKYACPKRGKTCNCQMLLLVVSVTNSLLFSVNHLLMNYINIKIQVTTSIDYCY